MATPQTAEQQLTVELTSFDNELAGIRDFCSEVIDSFWMDDDKESVLTTLQLAANEAVANVTEHGYMNQAGHPISCIATRFTDCIQIEIKHQGREFTPPAQAPQINEPLEGGMGLYLIEESVDQVTYDQTHDGWPCIRLVKFFNG